MTATRATTAMTATLTITDPLAPRRSARDLGPRDLVWDHFSRPRSEDTVAKIHAAARAGYAAIGLYLGAWAKLRENAEELERVDEALAQTGLVVANIETLRGWSAPGNADLHHQEQLAYEMAARWNCRYVQVIGDATGPLDQAANGFSLLCQRAAEHGLLVGLEWVPRMTNIEDCATALRIVTDADQENGGLCVDSWHFTRSTNNLEDLRALPGAKVVATQWNDGPVIAPHSNTAAEYLEDCLSNRVPPGDGEFDLVDIVKILDSIGSTAPIGVEVCSRELWAGPMDVAARASSDAMQRVLRNARSQ